MIHNCSLDETFLDSNQTVKIVGGVRYGTHEVLLKNIATHNIDALIDPYSSNLHYERCSASEEQTNEGIGITHPPQQQGGKKESINQTIGRNNTVGDLPRSSTYQGRERERREIHKGPPTKSQ